MKKIAFFFLALIGIIALGNTDSVIPKPDGDFQSKGKMSNDKTDVTSNWNVDLQDVHFCAGA